jgi:hypothetical protein
MKVRKGLFGKEKKSMKATGVWGVGRESESQGVRDGEPLGL